jgi:peptidyl-prolyl cis-trans isomerase C
LWLLTGLALVYLPADFIWHGPAAQAWERIHPDHHGLAARVNGEPVTQAQLDLATGLRLAARGLTAAEVDPAELETVRAAALQDLINGILVRQLAASEPGSPPADWVEQGIEDFSAGFPPGRLAEARAAEALDPPSLRALLTAEFAQIDWMDRHAGKPAVTEAEAKAWFEAHTAQLADPEVIRARHIFLSTVEVDTPEREQLIRDLHDRLKRGEADFAALAAQYSEDERSKRTGGELGFFARNNRLPKDFTDAVFALQAGQLGAPFRTAIGWHIVEVEERIPARPARWDDAQLRKEIMLHLQNEAKRRAVETVLAGLDRSGVEVYGP